MFEWIVPSEDSGKKLIAFLSERIGSTHSARSIKRAIEKNCCQINGRTERFASYPLAKGDHLILQLEDQSTVSSSSSIDPSRILYEDSDLLIYNKPEGMNSDEQGILKVIASYHSKARLIHRLDRDTTGVLLFAKHPKAFEMMVQAFKRFEVHKCYLAIVDGVLESREGSINNYLGKKHVYQGQTIWGAVSKEQGLHAHTDWIKIKEGKNCSLVYCFPKTGRTHQIRVHLSGIHHPILGDFQYCKKFECSYRPPRYLLHAYRISFYHPLTGKKMEIEAPIPNDFRAAQKVLFGA